MKNAKNKPRLFCYYNIKRMEQSMKITFNENKKIVDAIRKGLKAKDGYCPCKLDKTDDNICMCKEFRDQIADEDFEGYCHCRLYYKSK